MPTRELALQTSAIVKEIGKHTGVQCMVSIVMLDVVASVSIYLVSK